MKKSESFDENQPNKKKIGLHNPKTIFIVAIVFVFVLLVVVMLETGSLSNLMGNSVTDYYCEEGYALNGDKCIKTVKEKAYRIGDVNQDDTINDKDVTLISDLYLPLVVYLIKQLKFI